jgi:hypothetical protein
MKRVAQDSLIAVERSDPKLDMVSFRVRRFSAGLEGAAFRTIVESGVYRSAVNALQAIGKVSSATELFSRLYNQLDSSGARWESEQLEAGTLLKVGRMTFTSIPSSISALAKDPRVWGKELIRCAEGPVVYAFESVPSATPGEWKISVERIGGSLLQRMVGSRATPSTEMKPDRYTQLKTAIASDMPMSQVLNQFGLSRMS